MTYTRRLNHILSHWLFIAALGCLACVYSLEVCSARRTTTVQYDDQIRSAWGRYLPQYHWGVGWAQIQQESAGDPNARSPVGALGLAQFMPRTWEDMRKASVVPQDASPRDARHAIQAQAFYMWKLSRFWSSPRPDSDRVRLALVSYNAGAGNIHKSQLLCGNPSGYAAIMNCLPMITGRHAAETLGYVPRIERHYKRRFNYSMR